MNVGRATVARSLVVKKTFVPFHLNSRNLSTILIPSNSPFISVAGIRNLGIIVLRTLDDLSHCKHFISSGRSQNYQASPKTLQGLCLFPRTSPGGLNELVQKNRASLANLPTIPHMIPYEHYPTPPSTSSEGT